MVQLVHMVCYYQQGITEQASTLTDLHKLQGNMYHIKLVNRTMVVVAETNLQAALSASLLDLQAVRYKDLSIMTFKWSLPSSIVHVKVIIN